MSETLSKKKVRAMGAHPDMMSKSLPASRDQNQMNFGLVPNIPVRTLEPLVYYGPEKPHLQRWFKTGTRLYSIDFPVPRTRKEANDRLASILEEAMPLDIDMVDLVWSEKLGRWRESPKREYKTKLFGAFVVVDVASTNARGERATVQRFASLDDLQKPEDNPQARFKMATQK